jgi:hypothetical protein
MYIDNKLTSDINTLLKKVAEENRARMACRLMLTSLDRTPKSESHRQLLLRSLHTLRLKVVEEVGDTDLVAEIEATISKLEGVQ